MEWLIGIAFVMLLYWLVILRPGALGFWKLASKHPDAAYDHFVGDPSWKVFEGLLPENYEALVPKTEWDGPFRLWVPKLGGRSIFVFGRISVYEQSQITFAQLFSKKP